MAIPAVKCLMSITAGPKEDPVWTDISSYLLMLPDQIARGRDRISSRFSAGSCRIVLDNADRRFEPGYTGSPYYPYLKTTRRIRICREWAVDLTDNFNRADTAGTGSGNQLGTATTGQVWSASTGNSPVLAPQWHIASNTAQMAGYTGVYNESSWAVLDAGYSDASVQVTFASVAKHQGLVFRWASGTSFYKVRTRPDYGAYEVISCLAGIGSDVVIYTVPGITPTSGDVIKVVVVGANGYVYVNGTAQGSFTMGSNLTATHFGLGHTNNFANRDVPVFDDFSIKVLPRGNMFDGYVESIECEYETEFEGVAVITAVDGSKILNLLAPGQYSGLYDTFNRADGTPVTTADSGQEWHRTSGQWESYQGMAVLPHAATVRDLFVPDGRDNYSDDATFATDNDNHLGQSPTGQAWADPAGTGGNWLIYGSVTAVPEDYVFVGDWLTNRAFYENPVNADAAGFFRVGIVPESRCDQVLCRLIFNRTRHNTGAMQGFYFFGDGPDNYWALVFVDRDPIVGWTNPVAAYPFVLVRVKDGVPTFYRTYGQGYPGVGTPSQDMAYYYGLYPTSSAIDVNVYIEDGILKVFMTPVVLNLSVDPPEVPQPQYLYQQAGLPMGGFVPGSECGLLHNGISHVDGSAVAINDLQWGEITALGPSVLWMETGTPDGTIDAIIKYEDSRLAVSRPELAGKGIVFRYTDDANFWFAHLDLDGYGSPQYIYLNKVVDGDYQRVGYHYFGAPGSSTFPYSFADRTLNKLRVILNRSAIQVYWYGNLYLTTSDTFNMEATKHGLYTGNATYSAGESDDADWGIGVRGHDEFRAGPSLARQLSGARVNALLDLLGWPAVDRSIAVGTVYVAPLGSSLDIDPGSILEHINNAVDAEHGAFYFSADGKAVFEDRNTRLSKLTVQQVFDGSGVLGLPYLPNVRLRIDDASIYNEVKLTAVISEKEFYSGVLTSGALQGFYETGETASGEEFTVRYVTRGVTLTGATYVYVRMYESDGPYGPWTERTDLRSPYLATNDEVDMTVPGPTKRFKQFQLWWDAGTISVDLDVWMTSIPTEQVAVNSASIKEHYKRTYGPETVVLTSDADAMTLAELILAENQESAPRVDRLAVSVEDDSVAATLLALDISSRVQVLVNFVDGSPPVSQIGFIEGVAMEFGQNVIGLTYSLSQQNAGVNAWILDDPALSVLDYTTRLA